MEAVISIVLKKFFIDDLVSQMLITQIYFHHLFVTVHCYSTPNRNSYNTHDRNSYNTPDRNLFRTPFSRAETIRTSYKFQILYLWNSIPESVTVDESIRSF